ncbi:hypothetical protein B296_00016921 [Ensete ventricosum]|uniref:Uncharacterized protein n=1 Tax=Ensete ventricosum TaxID=4639 RepID=A0A426Z1D4_ENSVE|nr:hypothetical protein B296_00016921 [Ensete ventricosum]
MVPQRWDFRGVIDPLLSWRESIGCKRGRGDGECKGKLQVPRQGGRAKAKELHKTSVNELLIKIAESEGLRVDAKVPSNLAFSATKRMGEVEYPSSLTYPAEELCISSSKGPYEISGKADLCGRTHIGAARLWQI